MLEPEAEDFSDDNGSNTNVDRVSEEAAPVIARRLGGNGLVETPMPTHRTKTHWKTGLVLVVALAGGIGGGLLSPSDAEANPTQSIHRAYYNASFTKIVGGRWILECGGGSGPGWGRVTKNYVQTTAQCSGSQPEVVLCYVDGVLGTCPPIF